MLREPYLSLEEMKVTNASMFLNIPNSQEVIRPGNLVKLGRFSNETWEVCFGWYEFGGNRPVCGWYLTKDGGLTVKPIQLPDLDDIYSVQY